jgi:tRNA (guanine10-N2)-methyltransferase
MEYLFVFAQSHEEFRVPELLSISELHGFTIGFDRYANVLDMAIKRPFMILMLDKEEHAHILAQRCILIKCVLSIFTDYLLKSCLIRSVHEFYAKGSSYEVLHEQNGRARPQWERYILDTSFKFYVLGYNFTISQRRQRQIIESFAYMDFLGKIEMKNPEVSLTVFEECMFSIPLCSVVAQIKLKFAHDHQTRVVGHPMVDCTKMGNSPKSTSAGWCVSRTFYLFFS